MDAAVLKSLVSLSPEDLREVRDHASALLVIGPKHGKAVTDERNDFVIDLYSATSDLLYHKTQVRAVPYHVFAKTAQFRDHFLPAAKAASAANEQWFPKQSRTERISMVRLYAKLALDYLAGQGRPAVWYNLSAVFAALPELVDTAFPGYAANGLLGKVQLMRTKPK